MADVEAVRIGGDDGPLRKKPRISELPLSSVKRASIDALLHVFKKKGEFDALRKKTYKQFEEDGPKQTLIESLQAFTDEEIEREPAKYLAKDRRLAAPLLEGAAARANIYPKTEEQIGEFISKYLDQAEIALREIRRKDIGEDAATKEETKGAKSDDAYAAEAEIRRQERAKRHVEELRLKKKKEKEEAKKRELEALKKRAAELTKEKEKIEREQKRRAERESLRKKQKEAEAERLKKFQEEQERIKKEKEERQKKYEEDMAKRKKEEEAAEAKRLEEQAMRLLLREGERMAEKTGRRVGTGTATPIALVVVVQYRADDIEMIHGAHRDDEIVVGLAVRSDAAFVREITHPLVGEYLAREAHQTLTAMCQEDPREETIGGIGTGNETEIVTNLKINHTRAFHTEQAQPHPSAPVNASSNHLATHPPIMPPNNDQPAAVTVTGDPSLPLILPNDSAFFYGCVIQ
ncbi:hypothetical protein MBLNU457_3929t1 [Dothideomycetes sp. NU457]